ncbi:MAG: hypothetical protein JHC95_11695 [Solirubrobacteraceae bacterium]|nr:hypothetical protein [Solirubrobacteraceae bacterium]
MRLAFACLCVLATLIAVAGVRVEVASAWGVERTVALTAATPAGQQRADRAVMDGNGDVYLLQQYAETSFDDGASYLRSEYSIRVVKIPADAGSPTPSTTLTGRSYGAYISSGTYLIKPAGMAIDRSARRLYVSAGDRVMALDLSAFATAAWQELVGPSDEGGDWFARRALPGALAVDEATHRVYVADTGIAGAAFEWGGALVTGDPQTEPPVGPFRVQVFAADGARVAALPVCGAECLLGNFGLILDRNVPGPRAMHLRRDGTSAQLTLLSQYGDATRSFDVTDLTQVDAVGGEEAGANRIRQGIGTRPLGGAEGPLDFALFGDGSFVLPAFADRDTSLPDRLMELDPAGDVVRRFLPVAGGQVACRLTSGDVRLASDGADAPKRVAVVENAGGRAIRISVLRADLTSCSDEPGVARVGPAISFFDRDDESTVIANGTRIVVDDAETAIANVVPLAVDPDNAGADAAPWVRCELTGPGESSGGNCFPNGDALSFDVRGPRDTNLLTRPRRFTVRVTDDDGDTGTAFFGAVRAGQPLAASVVANSVTGSADAEFDLGQSTGDIREWKLDFGDGSSRTGGWDAMDEPISHTYGETRAYAGTLEITTFAGDKATAPFTVTAGAAAEAVAKLALVSPAVENGVTKLSLEGSQGNSWTLDWGDGSETSGTSFGTVLEHTYTRAVQRTATLVVTRGDDTDTTTLTVDVRPAGSTGPKPTSTDQPPAKACTTPLGIALAELGLGDPKLCNADPCDIDPRELGLTRLPIPRPASCARADDLGASDTGVVPRTGARPRLVTGELRLSADRRITLKVICGTGAGTCSGKVQAHVLGAAGGKAKSLGTVTFKNLAVGKTKTLRLRLSRATARAVREKRRARVRVTVTPNPPAAGIVRPRAHTSTNTLVARGRR